MTDILNRIGMPNAQAASAARQRWDSVGKPLGSLGVLEDAIVQIAALTGCADVSLERRALLVFCADHGVVAEGVTQCGSDVTAAVARALAEHRSTVSPMARLAHCKVLPVDVGMLDFEPTDGVLDRRIRNGTANMTEGSAMTRSECLKAICVGAELAMEQDADLLAVGEMGIGNSTAAAAVTAVLLGAAPEQVTGRGAGLSDAGLRKKIQAIQAALAVHHPDPADPVDVLAKVGGLELAAMCGAYLGAAARRVPVLIDGFISMAAALCAVRICDNARHAMLASHLSAEPASEFLMQELRLRPILSAGMRLGEGSGAVAVMPILDMALAVYNSNQTFSHLGIEPYTKQS